MAKKKLDLVNPSVSLFLICLLTALLLAVISAVTEPIIQAQNAAREQAARQEVLPAATEFEELEAGQSSDSSVELLSVYRGLQNQKAVGHVLSLRTRGYGGAVDIICATDSEARITGLRILSANETPGLGAKISDSKFYSQYEGKGGEKELKVYRAADQGRDQDPNAIDAIASATISTRAVTRAAQEAVAQSLRLLQAEKGGQ